MHEGRALWLYVEWLVYLLRGHYTLTIWKQRTEKFWALWNCKTRSLVISGASQVSGIISNYRLLCKSLESLTSWHLTNNQINPQNILCIKPSSMFSEGNLLSFTSQENLKFSQTNVISDSHQCQSLKLHFDKRTSDSDSLKVWALWLSLFAMLSYLG